jgi:hypothetical protein
LCFFFPWENLAFLQCFQGFLEKAWNSILLI